MAGKNSRVIVRIREMILHGELTPGQRVREVELAATLGVSRTPIRESLPILAQEGMLTQLDTRGFVVRAFTPQEIMDAIDVRGVLEGLAARMLAEQGPPRRLIQSLHECLREGDEIFVKRHLLESDEARYGEMNKQFHSLIVEGAGSKVIADAIARNDRIPFAAAHAIAFDNVEPSKDVRLSELCASSASRDRSSTGEWRGSSGRSFDVRACILHQVQHQYAQKAARCDFGRRSTSKGNGQEFQHLNLTERR